MDNRAPIDHAERRVAIALQFPEDTRVTYIGWRFDPDIPALLVHFTGRGHPPEHLDLCGHALVLVRWTLPAKKKPVRRAEYEVVVDA